MVSVSQFGPMPAAHKRKFFLAAEPWIYASPALILIITILLVPLGIGVSYAFRNIVLLDPFSGEFIGTGHFVEIWKDGNFWNALHNTIEWTVVSVLLQFVFGLILALLLNQPFPGRWLVQALVFLPWAVPSFLSGLNWAWLFNPVVGPLPHWFVRSGLMTTPENILSNPATALWGPIAANVWWGIPFYAITLLAALQSIPTDIYEAAQIDGAGPIKRFWSITLPFLAPTIAITLLLRAVWIANAADLIVVMTRGGPADSTQILASYIFSQAFQRLDFGYASAIATVLLVILLVYAAIVIALRQLIIRAH